MNVWSMNRASPDVMNCASLGARYEDRLVSIAMRSLFNSRTCGDAAVGDVGRSRCQFVLALGAGVDGVSTDCGCGPCGPAMALVKT